MSAIILNRQKCLIFYYCFSLRVVDAERERERERKRNKNACEKQKVSKKSKLILKFYY